MKMPSEMSDEEQIARVKAILITCGAAVIFAVLYKSSNFAELFDQSTLYLKMGGSYILGLAAVAVLFTVIGFAVSAGWRMGKHLGNAKDANR
jgi:hypothetical protein